MSTINAKDESRPPSIEELNTATENNRKRATIDGLRQIADEQEKTAAHQDACARSATMQAAHMIASADELREQSRVNRDAARHLEEVLIGQVMGEQSRADQPQQFEPVNGAKNDPGGHAPGAHYPWPKDTV